MNPAVLRGEVGLVGLLQSKKEINFMWTKEAGYGAALVAAVQSQVPTFGRIFIVMNGTSDYADPNYDKMREIYSPDTNGKIRFFTSISDAYDATTTNNNDVICLDAHTSHKVTSILTVSKNRVHFIGFDGDGHKIGARAMISNTSTGAATDYAMVKVTGIGCSFRNISFKNNWTVTENVSSVWDYSAQCLFENCDIESLGSAHLTNASAASLKMQGIESYYKNCTIGQQTLLCTVASGQQMLIAATTATRSARCIFENCFFQTWTSAITHCFIRASAASIDSSQHTFINCEFVNRSTVATGGVELTAAVATSSTLGGRLNFAYPRIFGAADLATSAGGATGVFVCSNVMSTAASDCISVQSS
jgi:hypothetical protein